MRKYVMDIRIKWKLQCYKNFKVMTCKKKGTISLTTERKHQWKCIQRETENINMMIFIRKAE